MVLLSVIQQIYKWFLNHYNIQIYGTWQEHFEDNQQYIAKFINILFSWN